MNNPAAKEPSMDEILSSIRQIIADDDEGSAPVQAAAAPEVEPVMAEPEPEPEEMVIPELEVEPEEDEDEGALALSAAQIVDDGGEELLFNPAPPKAPVVEPKEVEEEAAVPEELEVPELVVPDDISFGDEVEPEPEPEPEPEIENIVAAAAPMPDPDLSSDMADQLLEPTTDAAVKSTFAKLGNLGLGAGQLTIENMIREMLRPLLKEWLDENLPTMVENMVQNEIERLSRGK